MYLRQFNRDNGISSDQNLITNNTIETTELRPEAHMVKA